MRNVHDTERGIEEIMKQASGKENQPGFAGSNHSVKLFPCSKTLKFSKVICGPTESSVRQWKPKKVGFNMEKVGFKKGRVQHGNKIGFNMETQTLILLSLLLDNWQNPNGAGGPFEIRLSKLFSCSDAHTNTYQHSTPGHLTGVCGRVLIVTHMGTYLEYVESER
jgi:hypothetical protein